jgi:hypothetical protein
MKDKTKIFITANLAAILILIGILTNGCAANKTIPTYPMSSVATTQLFQLKQNDSTGKIDTIDTGYLSVTKTDNVVTAPVPIDEGTSPIWKGLGIAFIATAAIIIALLIAVILRKNKAE